ncbi:MAG: radical SAM protein [Candidatus Pacebacteria bacterium]|nr:radical SAM protein [Candidatus Paceibacterota bacterium]MDD4466948.1 radical SAM protein [Candidatus Paceibacterota bacterium]MDD5445736.1 radical SAM protein [Candidatus Paceibacterota bacterium]
MNYGQLIKLQEGEDIIILNPETKKWMLTSIQGWEIFLLKKRSALSNSEISLRVGILISDIIVFFEKIDDLFSVNDERVSSIANSCSIHLTSNCNMGCLHCRYSCGQITDNLPLSTIQKYLEGAIEDGSSSLTITGGEPLTNWLKCREVIILARRIGMKVNLLTNGSLISPKIASFLGENDVNVQVSLDSLNEERFYQFRGHSLNRVKIGIERLVRFKVNVGLSFVLSRLTLDGFYEVIEYAQRVGVKGIHLPFLEKGGRGNANWQQLSLGDDEMINFWNHFLSLYFSGGLRSRLTCSDVENILLKIIYPPVEDCCRCGRTTSTLYPDGKIYACTNLVGNPSFILGKPGAITFQEMRQKDNIVQLPTVKDISECSNCHFGWICLGGCRDRSIVYYGNEYHIDPWCEVFKWLFNKLIFCAARLLEKKEI